MVDRIGHENEDCYSGKRSGSAPEEVIFSGCYAEFSFFQGHSFCEETAPDLGA